MKGKITIVLLGLALVFGMIAASCDNGAYPAVDNKDELTLFAYDGTKTNESPILPLSLKKEKELYNLLQMKVANPDTTKGGFVQKFILTTTGGIKTGDDGIDAGNGTSVAEAKKQHAGSRIIVNNPVLVTAGLSVTPVPTPNDPDPDGDPITGDKIYP